MKTGVFHAGVLAATLLLAGCEHFAPQPLEPRESAATLNDRRLDGGGLRDFLRTNAPEVAALWPLPKWNLSALTLAGFYYHPNLTVAKAQWRVALAGALAAGARPNPSLSFSPAYDTQIPGNPSPWIIPVSLDIPIETAGKRAKRIAEAEKVAESARWSYAAAAWQIRSEVRSRLLELKITQERAGLLQKQLSAETNVLHLLQGQVAAGALARSETMSAQIAMQKTAMDLNEAMTRQAAARAGLAEAVGIPATALENITLDLTLPQPDLGALTSGTARELALQRRADVLGALADYAASEAELRLQLAKQYPDLHLGPAYAWNNGNAGDNEWTLGMTLELPILDQNQGPIRQALAQRELSAAKFTALQAQVGAQIDRAVALVAAARQQSTMADQLFTAEQQQERTAQAQWQNGAGDRLQFHTVQLEVANAALVRIDSEEKFQVAVGALEEALQSPADHLAEIIRHLSTARNGKP